MRDAFAFLLVLAVAACSNVTAPSPPPSAALSTTPYTTLDLGTLGGASSAARDVNANEEVVGSSLTATGETHAFLWSAGVLSDLGTLGGAFSTADDINDGGAVAGRSTNDAGEMRAFLWTSGNMVDLGHASGAVRVNERGAVAWHGPTPDGSIHAFLWRNGILTDLGTLGGTLARVTALGESGEVVGASTTEPGSPVTHAFVWRDGAMTALDDFGGSSSAAGINAAGQIVGIAYDGARSYAVLWEGGTMNLLEPLPGDVTAAAIAINDAGWVAGESYSSSLHDSPAPFRWQGGVMLPLDAEYQQSVDDQRVVAMNPAGVVVGTQTVLNRTDHARAWEYGAVWELGTLGGASSSAAAINLNGTVVGRAQDVTGSYHAVAWRRVLIL